ncbi:autotransporter domain-containing protein, partial [Telmatospirillum sp.]|uniref:autotransporter domain-containing protein n=1 Tax=Telmatospirillum sp. TaxID=2079197 RepID=UPI00283BC913
MLMQRQFSQFLASTAPVALGVAAGLMAAAPAYADTTVNSGTTATYNTSTAGNVTVSGTGTLTGASGAVITIDSSNTATVNSSGTLYAGTATNPVTGNIGIQANAGVTTTITNAGTISVLENFAPDTTKISGSYTSAPVSGVSGRYGIYGAAGGTLNAAISNTGTIYVDGENSAGIQVDSTLNGSLSSEGTISVLGDNSYGVKLANVTGNVTVGGTITVTGSAAQGYLQAGNVTGQILIDGAISNSTSYTDTAGTSLSLSLAKLNTGTPIVEIDGNVTGGILLNAPTSSTSSDTNRGSISSYGNNPALQIGGANAIVIGAGTTDNGTYALGIDGSVTATASDSNTNATALVIGKAGGGTVALTTASQPNGLEVYGTITATTQNASATAILINSNATVASILNTGTIKAVSNGQSTGNIYAIQDLSGTVSTLTNQGYITVPTSTSTSGTAAAIDLSKNTSGVTLTQSYTSTNQSNETTDKATSGYNAYKATEYAGITGNILLGTGNNTMTIGSGSITGNTVFGAGGSNTVTMADTTRWVGNITFGSGGTQSIAASNYAQFSGNLELSNDAGSLTVADSAIFLGAISDGTNFNVTVNGGTFGANATTASTVKSLTVASGGSLRVLVDPASAKSSTLSAQSATFLSGSKISVAVISLATTAKQYDVLTASTLSGASALTTSSLNLPSLFTGSISTDANNLYVTVAPASAAQLGLTAAQASAYGAILKDATANVNIQNTLLQIYDTATLRGRFNEMLPNYSGGTFDIVSRATRLANKHFDDDTTMFSISDSSAWLEPIVFSGTRAFGDTAGFKTTGGGLSAGYEKVTPVGNVGFQLAWLTGNAKAGTYQSVKTSAFELGLFWRKSSGPLYIWAGGNLGRESFNSTRTFFGEYTTSTTTAVTTTDFTYSAAGHWAGWSAALTAGASYTVPLGDHFSLRPRGVIAYDRLKENAYIESGDTPIALSVAGRTNSETTATTTLAAKWSSG